MRARNVALHPDSHGARPPVSSGTGESEVTTLRLYRVREGDTLRGIAKRFYGYEDFWRVLYEANSRVLGAPAPLPSGTILHLPEL